MRNSSTQEVEEEVQCFKRFLLLGAQLETFIHVVLVALMLLSGDNKCYEIVFITK